MMRMRAVVGGVALLIATASPSAADVITNPDTGPPGTTVTVSGVTSCEGEPDSLSFETAEGASVGAVPAPFTPPSGTIVVPDVADGDYHIGLNCGAGEGFVDFTVARAVAVGPTFAG
jgi:hypothetical protein